jgi:hypothetical protein
VDVPESAAIDAMKQHQMPQFVNEMTTSLNQIIRDENGKITNFIRMGGKD